MWQKKKQKKKKKKKTQQQLTISSLVDIQQEIKYW